MSKNRISFAMIKYELRNVCGNPFVHIFGVGFPIFMSIIMSKTLTSGITDNAYINELTTSLFLGMGAIIPLATILMGYTCTCAQEIEKSIPLRMQLFGYSEKYTIINRLIAEFVYMTVAIGLYFTAGFVFLKISPPKVSGLLIYLVCLYLLAAVLFVLAHAVANLTKKFGLAYLISMIAYFGMMVLSGMMGISVENLPKSVQVVSDLLPTTYFNKDFITVWSGKSYNYAPMIQSYIFLFAISGILTFIMLYRSRRSLH